MRLSFPVFSALPKWHRELRRIPNKEALLPVANNQPFHAWYGDKVLGAAAARAIARTKTDIQDPGTATKLVSHALSNRFLAKNITTLLPNDVFLRDGPLYSDHQLGSILEAAVAHVSKLGADKPNADSQQAVDELAEWLISNVSDENSSSFKAMPTFSNPKGRLLELGGSVDSRRVGGWDHKPKFEATAQLLEYKSVTQGFGAKKTVEREAARNVLQQAVKDAAIDA